MSPWHMPTGMCMTNTTATHMTSPGMASSRTPTRIGMSPSRTAIRTSRTCITNTAISACETRP